MDRGLFYCCANCPRRRAAFSYIDARYSNVFVWVRAVIFDGHVTSFFVSIARWHSAAQIFVYGREKSCVCFDMDIFSIMLTVLVRFALLMGAIGAWLCLGRIVRWLINDF